VIQFGVAGVSVPVPAAYNGGGIDLIASFLPVNVNGSGADSFNVASSSGYYQVSFTSAAVEKLGFTYKAGDIPAPADYDGVGRDEFAIYRPSTGQFFILNTPNVSNSATWTLRTVSLNLPGGPNVNDVPVSEDYDGNGMVDPAVYRPSTSTFFIIHSSTGIQSNIQFGTPGGVVAAAGPLLYRLTALKGTFSSTDGYSAGTDGLPGGGGGTLSAFAFKGSTDVSAATTSTSSATVVPSTIAVASPMLIAQPITTSVATPSAIAIPTTTPTLTSATTVSHPVTIGSSTPKTTTSAKPKAKAKAKTHEVARPTHTVAHKTEKSVKVETKHPAVVIKTEKESSKVQVTSTTKATSSAVPLILQKLVTALKGKKKKD
jgi:hypothetical protein